MTPLDPGLLAVCLALCAPVPADNKLDLPPADLLEFLGEFGNDDGSLIDPTRLPAPGKTAPQPTPAPAAEAEADDARR